MGAHAPRWQHVETPAGHHLRLVGGNGEIVLTSEVYTDPRQVDAALRLVRKTASSWSAHQPERVQENPDAPVPPEVRTAPPVLTPRIDRGAGHSGEDTP